ncbi:MAG: DNA repair protein RecN [Verrucomicrobia bacterium]|nr:DNA repair protein RecN [Verrucomicrobiota bacterium]
MLTSLRIKNLALVADLSLDLQPGCNVITGETGAGKSMLIGALNLVLGERADRSLIRAGTDGCSVEAVFDMRGTKSPLKSFLEENGLEPCEEDQLLIKRVFTSAGSNRQFINGSPTTLSALGTLGEWLVDIHGPHEHQSLLHPARQLAILDAFGKLEPEREQFASLLALRSGIEREKAALIVDEKTYEQQMDLLRHQTREIREAQLKPDEEESVEADYRRASNGARLLQLAQTALDAAAENEASVLTQAGVVGRVLQELRRIDSTAEGFVTTHAQAVALWDDLRSSLSHYVDRLDLDPAQLEQLESRLNLIHALKRKYGGSLTEVIEFGAEAARKLEMLEQRDAELAKLNTRLKQIDGEIWSVGQTLSTKRRKLIPHLAKAVCRELGDLGFKQSRFDVSILCPDRVAFDSGTAQVTSSGLDTAEFQFAPNPGEPPRPLRAIASSGELARVMLALKTVLAAVDQVPVLVFDEVDANVGGETARAVGEKMRQIARNRQVLCITHLPQVAAPAGAHFVATKQVRDGRTISEITLLTPDERVTELARMLGGQTEAARRHALAMLENKA